MVCVYLLKIEYYFVLSDTSQMGLVFGLIYHWNRRERAENAYRQGCPFCAPLNWLWICQKCSLLQEGQPYGYAVSVLTLWNRKIFTIVAFRFGYLLDRCHGLYFQECRVMQNVRWIFIYWWWWPNQFYMICMIFWLHSLKVDKSLAELYQNYQKPCKSKYQPQKD